ncbi:MAG: hypothetical protein ABEJ77_02355 [Halanaeroarchaeum sp.]
MQSRTVEQVESWDARPFSGGYRELYDLADEDFSGAVVADDVWSFFLNGRVVGVFQGEITDFASESGTVYAAPDDSLPLLFSMQERGGSTRAKYFTNDTSISEAHETLSDANFTGYLELSENVLSGDYYVSYYGGKSMSTAFVGQSDRLLTGEEAFERADDEVGVFEVRTVSMNITEIPEPRDDGAEDAAETAQEAATASTAVGIEEAGADERTEAIEDHAAGTADDGGSTADDGEGTDDDPRASERTADDGRAGAQGDATDRSPEAASARADDPEASEAEARDSTRDPTPSDGVVSAEATDTEATPSADRETPSAAGAEEPSRANSANDGEATAREPAATTGDERSSPSDPAAGSERTDTDADRGDDASMSEHERRVKEWGKKDRDEREAAPEETPFREEAAWRRQTAIPALDPEESGSTGDDDGTTTATSRGEATTGRARGQGATPRSQSTASRSEDRSPDAASSSDTGGSPADRSRDRSPHRQPADPDRVSKLEDALANREDRIEDLESSLDEAEAERDELEDRVASLKAERDDLEERIADLEADLEQARAGGNGEERTSLPAQEALAGTNLFVRYDSKGKPTLSGLADGDVDPAGIDDNLRLEHHTQFEAAETSVDGVPFERFLEESSRYRFVDWLVRDLPFEVLDSDATTHLKDVYEAIPSFDRIEFDGTVAATTEEGEDRSHDFDVVVRDRMGDPLVVADINESRDPVSDASMDDLVTGASAVSEAAESLAGAFYLTASFFEPGALERAQEATEGGGFFSRSDRESYVKVGRKRGYHLCLVEDRGEAFHLTVPEL